MGFPRGLNWRALNGGQNLMALVLEGCVFTDGIREVRDGLRKEAAPALTAPQLATAAA